MSPSQSAITQWGWGFHTLRGGSDPGDPCFCPRVVGVVEIWKIFRPGDGNLPSPGSAGPRRWPEGQLSPHAGSMSPSQSAITQWGWGFHTLRGGIDPGDLRFRWSCRFIEDFLTRGWELILPGCGRTSTLSRGETLAARWIHEPQVISNHPVGSGFPHPAGRYRPRGI